jgi:hypothetical protein
MESVSRGRKGCERGRQAAVSSMLEAVPQGKRTNGVVATIAEATALRITRWTRPFTSPHAVALAIFSGPSPTSRKPCAPRAVHIPCRP